MFSEEHRIQMSLDKVWLSLFDKCSGHGDGLWLRISLLSSNYKHDNNFPVLLELQWGHKSWEEVQGWAIRRRGGTFLIWKLLYLDYWLFKHYQIAFPDHCIRCMFDLHDEQMISFSWNRSSKTLQRKLWRDAVDLAAWEAAEAPFAYRTPAWTGNHMGVGRGQVGSSLWVMIYHLPYI